MSGSSQTPSTLCSYKHSWEEAKSPGSLGQHEEPKQCHFLYRMNLLFAIYDVFMMSRNGLEFLCVVLIAYSML